MLKILIVGATSAIAQATARHFAADGAAFFLVGRNPEKLAAVADDLRVYGASRAETFALDLNHVERHAEMINTAVETLGGLDAALIAHGTLTDQAAAQADVALVLREINTNALSAMAVLTLLANHFEAQRRGSIAVIASVAGDRGRGSNYVYGAAKAALIAFTSGLRNRLHKSGVHVLTVKPGLVDTPMTAGLKKGPLFASPARVGADIYRAMKRGQNELYTPWFWRYIMLVIVHIPEAIFKRLSL